MTERSRFWNGVATGDATEAPYDASTEFAAVLRSVTGAAGVATNLGGVFAEELNELAVTGSTSPVSVASGRALAYGNWYESDAAVSVAVPTPAASTRIDRIVLRKNWVAQTVRVTRIAGVEGGAAPALVQIAGTTWDTPLSQASITTGGAITLTDQREFIQTGSRSHQHSSTSDGGSGPLRPANGVIDAPAHSYISEANSGWYRAGANDHRISIAGIDRFGVGPNYVWIPATAYYTWVGDDTKLYRDAANVLAQRNNVTPQELRIYGTTTGSKFTRWSHDGSHGFIGTAVGAGHIYISPNDVNRWRFGELGGLYPVVDNNDDLGDASLRVRTIYAGMSVLVGTGSIGPFSKAISIFNAGSNSALMVGETTSNYGAWWWDNSTGKLKLRMNIAAAGDVDIASFTRTLAQIDVFTDITGGLRVKGVATNPGVDASSVSTYLYLSMGSNGGANNNEALLGYFRSNLLLSLLGHGATADVIAGVTKNNDDFGVYLSGLWRAFFDASDSGTLVLANHIKMAGDLYWRSATAFDGVFDHAITASRTWTFPNVTGKVLLGHSAVKTADESVNNTTTLQPDDSLILVDVKSGVTYAFDMSFHVQEAVAGMNFKFAFDIPGAGTLQAWATAVGNFGASSTVAVLTVEVTDETAAAITFADASAARAQVTISGFLTPAADGNVAFQWAQNSAVVGDLTIHSGATFKAAAAIA